MFPFYTPGVWDGNIGKKWVDENRVLLFFGSLSTDLRRTSRSQASEHYEELRVNESRVLLFFGSLSIYLRRTSRSQASEHYEELITKHSAGLYFSKVSCAKKVICLNNITHYCMTVIWIMTIYVTMIFSR